MYKPLHTVNLKPTEKHYRQKPPTPGFGLPCRDPCSQYFSQYNSLMPNQKPESGSNENLTYKQVGLKAGLKSKFTIKIITRGAVIRLAVLAAVLLIFCLWGYFTMVKMPGKSYAGLLPPLTDA